MAAETDPFSQVYDALWDLLQKRGDFNDKIKLRNRIRFDERINRSPFKDKAATADFPEVVLLPVGTTPHLQRTSNGSSCIQRLEIRVATGDLRLQEFLYPLQWIVYRALVDWVSVLSVLTWNGQTFVQLSRPVSIADGISAFDTNRRGIEGWTALWACEVEMWFSTADLTNSE